VAESQALYWADDGYYTPQVRAWAETKSTLSPCFFSSPHKGYQFRREVSKYATRHLSVF